MMIQLNFINKCWNHKTFIIENINNIWVVCDEFNKILFKDLYWGYYKYIIMKYIANSSSAQWQKIDWIMVRVWGDGSASKNVSDASPKTRVLSLKSTGERGKANPVTCPLTCVHHNSHLYHSHTHTHSVKTPKWWLSSIRIYYLVIKKWHHN